MLRIISIIVFTFLGVLTFYEIVRPDGINLRGWTHIMLLTIDILAVIYWVKKGKGA